MRGLRIGLAEHLLGASTRVREHALGFLAGLSSDPGRIFARALGIGVQAGHRRNRLVPARLGLRARLAEDLLGLLLGCAHAVLGRPVRLRDALAAARLRPIADL